MRRELENTGLIFLLVVVDQIIKFFIRHKKVLFHSKILSIKLSQNTGAVFGVMKNNALIIAFFSLITLGLILLYYDKLQKLTSPTIINLVIAGITSNTIDRFFLGYVTDYICLNFWPCFNLADASVVIATGMIGWKVLKKAK